MGEQSSSRKYPGEVEVASTDPDPIATTMPLNPDRPQEEAEASSSKRTRKRSGYYKQLHDGSL